MSPPLPPPVVAAASTPVLSIDAALGELCDENWAREQAGTRHQEAVLRALLPLSRATEGRRHIGSTPSALRNLVALLDDNLIFHDDVGAVCVRLLRNVCARCPENQSRLGDLDAHGKIIDLIERRIDDTGGGKNTALRRINGENSGNSKLAMPFFGFAVEFLVNFITGHADNAELVWERAFPTIFAELLESTNDAASSAASALIHNCVAILPGRITDVVKIWQGNDGGKTSMVESILSSVHKVNEEEEDKLSWVLLVIKRLVEAGLFGRTFVALGHPLCSVISDKDKDWSKSQEIFLGVLEAALAKSAARTTQESAWDVRLPDDSLPFLCEVLETSVLKGKRTIIQLTLSIAGSAIIMCTDSERLETVKLTCAKVAVETLRMISKQEPLPEKDNQGVGLRGSAIRAVALSCDEYKPAQDLVRNSNGLVFVLSALSYEEDPKNNPFLREWAIMAVRNLCADNAENCAAISSYELQAVKNDSELLKKTGLEAYIDDQSGKIRLRKKKDQDADAAMETTN